MHVDSIFKKDSLVTVLIIFVICIACFLRLYLLESYPMQVNQDELSNIYDGYSIAETGADRWGQKHPIILRAFGNPDYRPPLCAWLCAVSIKIVGYSIFSGRLPSAILGCISLLLIYVVSNKIGGKLFAFFALLFAALSPWHILFSRMAHEGAILPAFFIILTLYLWLKVKENNYLNVYLILLGLTIGIATNVYQSTKLIFLLISILIVVEIFKKAISGIEKIAVFALSVFVGALPQIIAAIKYPEHFFSRANGTMVEFSWSFEYFQNFFSRFFSNLSPHFLFYSFGEFNNLTIARLLSIEACFFYIGLVVFFIQYRKTKTMNPLYLYILLVVAILPSALTYDSPHALRASSLIVVCPIFSAAGIVFVLSRIKNTLHQKIFIIVSTVLIFYNGLFLLNRYTDNIALTEAGQQNVMVQISEKLNTFQKDYSKVYIEDIGNQPYLYVASYCNMHPKEFQAAEKKLDDSGFDHFTQMGKYFFYNRENIESVMNDKTGSHLFFLHTKSNQGILIDSMDAYGRVYYFYKNK